MKTTTEHATLNTVIHAAFRRDLTRFDRALASADAEGPQRAGQIATAWDNFDFQLHHHHTDEETIFWPVLRTLGASEALAAELESEHARMVVALEHAEKAMDRFRTDPGAGTRTSARAAVAELAEVVDDHLRHEERDLEPIAAAHHGAPEMKAAQKAVRRTHRGNTGTFFTWLLDGADHVDVRGVRRDIPGPVLFVVTHTSGRRYRRTVASVWT